MNLCGFPGHDSPESIKVLGGIYGVVGCQHSLNAQVDYLYSRIWPASLSLAARSV